MGGYSEIDLTSTTPVVKTPRIYNASSDFIARHLEVGRADKIAVIDEAGSYSYADLNERVNRVGNAMTGLGLKMGDRVAIALLDTIDFPAVFFGCIKAGIVPIPLNTWLTGNDYEYILGDCRVQTLVVSQALYEKFEPLLDKLPFLNQIIVSGEESAGHPLLSELTDKASPDMQTAPTTQDDIAFWLYSSGSTGTPKGIIHLQSHLVNTAVLYGIGILGINEKDIVFSAAKLFFAYGLGNAMSFPFLVGATSILLSERPTPAAVLDIIKRYQPTVFYGVPSLYAGLLADPANHLDADSHSLRVCASAGEPLPEEIGRQCEEWLGVPVLDGIGSTEMLQMFMSNRLDDNVYGTTGKPVPGYEVKLVNDKDEEVGVGEIGELAVSGPTSAMAYWNQKEKSLHTFRGRWTYTGDKYTVDAKGYYTYSGRTDDMLKVSGQWVSPFEVESTIIQHSDVLEAAVVGMIDDNDLIKPKAYVLLNTGVGKSDKLAAEIKEFVKSRLAKHKYPRWIEFVDSLPKTATGKIQRYKLRR